MNEIVYINTYVNGFFSHIFLWNMKEHCAILYSIVIHTYVYGIMYAYWNGTN